MKITKQARRNAKRLLKNCKVNGLIDENRVRQTVALVSERKPRGYLAALTHFQRLVRLEVQRQTVRIESAVALDGDLRSAVQANLARKHGAGLAFEHVTNPALLGGLRIKVGSDVYDGSIRARLGALEESLTK